MKTTRHSRRRLLFLLLLIAGAVTLTALLYPRHADLLQRATKAGSLPGDSANRLVLSDREVLLWKNTKRPRGPSWEGDLEEDLSLHDMQQGKTTFLPGLTAWYNKLERPFEFVIIPSPDGTRLLFWRNNSNDPESHVIVRDGTLRQEITPVWTDYYPCWLGDSRRWVQFSPNPHSKTALRASLHAIATPAQPKRHSIEKSADGKPQEFRRVLPNGRILALHQPNARPVIVETYTLRWQGSPLPLNKSVIPMPADGILYDKHVSPAGDRIAWVLHYETNSPIRRLMERWVPALQKRRHSFASLWISRFDGSNMREIGRVASPRPPDYTPVLE